MQRLIVFFLVFFSISLLVYILMAGQVFFVPFLTALVIAYFIIALANGIRKLSLRGRHVPPSLAFLGSISMLLGAVYFIFSLVGSNVAALLGSAPVYQEKFIHLIDEAFKFIDKPTPDFSQVFKEFDLGSFLTSVVLMLTDLAGRAGMITIYTIFLLIEFQYFEKKLVLIFKSEAGKESVKTIIKKIGRQIQSYLVIKTILSALTASCSYLILVVLGVDFPEFWALLIFLLNYIPTIGSIVATLFPCLLTLVQFGSLWPFLVVSICLIAIQFVIGNIVEPRMMGKHFNLSGLVVILSLAIWGQIWGVIGMLLCVPFTIIMSIILSNFSQTRPFAILLSKTGALDGEETVINS